MFSSDRIRNKPSDYLIFLVIGLISVFIAVFSILNVAKYRLFSVTSFGWVLPFIYRRLAAFSNPLNIFLLPEFNVIIFLAPINYFIAFAYAAFPHPEALLVFQVFIMSAGALPVYLLALRRLNNSFIAFSLFLVFLLHPLVTSGSLLGYIPFSMGMPFLLWEFYYLEKNDFRKFMLFAVLANLTKIDVVLMNMIFGLVLCNFVEKKKYGKTIFKISAIWMTVALFSMFFYLKHINKPFPIELAHCERYGERPVDLLRYASTHVIPLMKNLFCQKNLLPSILISFPFGISILAPYFLLPVLPEIGYVLLRNQHSSGHFTMLAFVFLSCIYAIRNIANFLSGHDRLKNFKIPFIRILAFGIMVASLCRYYFIVPQTDFASTLGPLPFTAKADLDFYKLSYHGQTGERIISDIPAGVSCLTQQSAGAHLGKCKNLGIFNRYFVALHFPWDYVLVDLLKEDFYQISKRDYYSALYRMMAEDGYGVLHFEDGWLLLKRDHKGKDDPAVLRIIKKSIEG